MSIDLFDLSRKRAQLAPDKIAFEDLNTGITRTYKQINTRADHLATYLINSGIKHGDRIAVLCRNRIEFFELLFACAKTGAILVPLNWRMPATELEPIINDCQASALFFGETDKAKAYALLNDNIQGFGFDEPHLDLKLQANSEAKTRTGWPGSDVWYLLYTSGTTGKPKAVIQTYQMALVNSINIGQAINISSEDRTLNYLPLFHTAGINLHTLPTFINGGLIKILDGFDVDRVIDLLSKGDIDTFFAVPAVYQAIAEHPDFSNITLGHVRSLGCGGAAMPDILIEKFAEKGALVCNGMGMTETGPTLFLMDKENVKNKIGSVGKPQLLAQVRLSSATGESLTPDEEGELEVFGPGVTPGYFNNAEETKKTFTVDGWLKTGDIARQDSDGYYYIVGRSKEMYISGGENVFPGEIENVLVKHPSVLEAAVIGVPDKKWGEVGHAYLILREEHTLDAKALTVFCRTHLASFKVPKSFSTVTDFPRTAAGKVRKHMLMTGENNHATIN